MRRHRLPLHILWHVPAATLQGHDVVNRYLIWFSKDELMARWEERHTHFRGWVLRAPIEKGKMEASHR